MKGGCLQNDRLTDARLGDSEIATLARVIEDKFGGIKLVGASTGKL